MQIFVKNLQGMAITLTLNVESSETICCVKRRLGDKEGIHSDVVQILIYGGKHLDDSHSLAHYNILQDSTLHLLTRKRLPHIYVKTVITRKIITLPIVGLNTIYDVKAKIHEHEGIPPNEQCLYFATRKLDGNQTLLGNHIGMESTLYLVLHQSVYQSSPSELAQLNVTSQGRYNQHKRPVPQVAPQQTKRARPPPQTKRAGPAAQTKRARPPPQTKKVGPAAQAKRARPPPQTKKVVPAAQTIPSKATPNSNSHSIFDTNDGEVCAEYMHGLATSADPQPMSHNDYDAKLNVFALHQAKATAAFSNVMPEIRSRPPSSVLTELEDVKREMVTARSKEKELEATISRLAHENKVISVQRASYKSKLVALEAENKKTKEELTVTRSTEKKLEVTISRLKTKNKVFSDQCASYKCQVVALEAENKKTKELMVSHSKEKEQEATIARLTHKNEVFSAQCASYESQVVGLEAEYKKTKEELMVADKKFYSGARATGYAEGLREGKTKWLKSVEFLHHLTDASMEYFDYGFDSCQKQAEHQGFVGQLNKDSALKEAPFLKDGNILPKQSKCPLKMTPKMAGPGRNI